MTYLYDRIVASRKGSRAMSSERLKYQILKTLHRAITAVGITQTELAKRLGVRKSAVNQVFKGDGNVRIATLAEYMHEMGLEIALQVLPLGTQRAQAMAEISRHWTQGRSLQRSVSTAPAAPSDDDGYELEKVNWHRPPERSERRAGTAFVSVRGR